eukprot:14237497-Alexandrium_andersonii.AAC.1
MSASLVGSEMCIRDRFPGLPPRGATAPPGGLRPPPRQCAGNCRTPLETCLLYTSDAADDM